MTDTVTDTKVVEMPKVADTHIECELCGAQYEKRAGSTNDCPLCNTPGGKNPTTAEVQAMRDGAGALAPLIDSMTRNMGLLSGRIAAVEQEIAALKAVK